MSCDPAFVHFYDPVVKCSWTDYPVGMGPLVADLENDGDLEIIAYIEDWQDAEDGKLLVLRAEDCVELYRSPTRVFADDSALAVADLDGDSDLEIVGLYRSIPDNGFSLQEVVVTDHLGNVLDVSPQASIIDNGWSFLTGGAAIANLDGQGPPEIVYAGMALRFENGSLTTLWNNQVESPYWGFLSVVADVDLDGVPEVVTGNRIFDGPTGADETPANVAQMVPGYVAVADFDPNTPEPEIVLVSGQDDAPTTITVFHPVTGDVVFGPVYYSYGGGGPPTVGDVDADGQLEIALVTSVPALIDPECDPNNPPDYCMDSSKWTRWQGEGSALGVMGATLFDFNRDGRLELVYRDSHGMSIFDASSGTVLAQSGYTFRSRFAPPITVDVDGDGRAEVVVSSDYILDLGPKYGIYVLEDVQDRWVAARTIWNQHSYHVTNVDSDGSVPLVETNNWTVWNNYRQQVGPDNDPCTMP